MKINPWFCVQATIALVLLGMTPWIGFAAEEVSPQKGKLPANKQLGSILGDPLDLSANTQLSITATGHQRREIYHSPQSPGYTCWTGSWLMPEGNMMLVFTQATGPIEGRPSAPKAVQVKLDWPPAGRPKYDMTGLDMQNVYLRSGDGGMTWEKVSEDSFISTMNGTCSDAGHVALPDGTLLRNVWGQYLPYNPELPKTGFLQRSVDKTKTWGPPELPMDPKKFTTWPKRLRTLRGGRLLLLGGFARAPAGSLNRLQYQAPGMLEPLLLVAEQDGRNWQPVAVLPAAHRKDWTGEEYDVAELPNGDLLCVFRRNDPKDSQGNVRWQGLLKKQGETWVPDAKSFGPAPFPHSGHPELLAARKGVVLHLATTGIHWTADAGQSWHPLKIPATSYYPSSVQTQDGTIHVFSHNGGDNAYGNVDQAIVMDSFRLKVE